jgi:hypothetical protein
MIFVYAFVLVLLCSLKFLVQRRTASLGRRYSALAQKVQSMLATAHKAASTHKADLCQLAIQHYELGLLAKKRDRLESRTFAWQSWSERLSRWVRGLRDWKGRTLPYLVGVVDVCLVLGVIEFLGMSEYATAHGLAQLVTDYWPWN